MTKLLLADDDIELCELLSEYLSSEGFSLTVVNDGAAAVKAIHKDNFGLLILDVMMPQLNGFEALREVRKQSQIPVLMLTARGDDVDRIVGLEMGADDYLAKPCNPRELVARIRAILRRASSKGATNDDLLQIGEVELHPASRKLYAHGKPLDVTSTEFNVLKVLMEHAGEVVSKKELTEQVLERKLTQYDRSMDMHVSNLRKKIGRGEDGDNLIKTIHGVGYIFVTEAEHGKQA